MLDTWLEYASRQYECSYDAKDKVEWNQIQQYYNSNLVPITVGYKRIAPLYDLGKVKNERDINILFCFVEAIFSVGEWLSPSRVTSMDKILWHYHYDDSYYVCKCTTSTNNRYSDFE